MSINKAVIKTSEEAILEILGTLADLPYDTANTVANIYYRYFLSDPDWSIVDIKKLLNGLDDVLMEDSDNPAIITQISIDSLEDTRKSGVRDSIIGAEFICINKLIQVLRVFRDHPVFASDRIGFFSTLGLIPDIFKYRISRALDKTPIRRNIERKLKQSKVDEIPNLVDFMEVCINEEDDEY